MIPILSKLSSELQGRQPHENDLSSSIFKDNDGSQQDARLPSIFIHQDFLRYRTRGLQFHSRSSSTIPATMNKKYSVLRILFRLQGHSDKSSRIVIKVVKESKVLFEIENWTHPSYKWSKIDRYYNSSHDYIKNLEEGCHFELHYAVSGENYLEIKDFELCVEDIESIYLRMRGCSIPEVELRGISIKQLKAVYTEIEARCEVEGWTDKDGRLLTPEKCNLYDIKDRIIMKRTESQQCSYVELIATGPQKPTRFVSHSWSEPVIAMIRCLDQHCEDHELSEETSYYWIDAYANNHHKIADEMLANPFLKAMSICQGTVSILDAGCVVYSRIWCIFEIFKSVMGGNSNYELDVYTEIDRDRAVGITHGYIPRDRTIENNFGRSIKKSRESTFPLDRILQAINVDVKQAQASIESDRRFILNTITGRSVDDEVLDSHAKYEELNSIFRGIFVVPALDRIIKETDVDTITRCFEILEESNARVIDLNLNYCSRFDDDLLIKLADCLPPTLIEFTLVSKKSAVTQNGINSCIAKIISCPQLVKLNLANNGSEFDGVNEMVDALKENKCLKILDLSRNNIGNDGAIKIAEGLIFNRSLQVLDLSLNNIGNDGAIKIAEGLKSNHYLKVLHLYHNNIDIDVAIKIKEQLRFNHNLHELNLSSNNIDNNDKEQMVQDASLSPLHFACEANELTRVQQLIKEGTDVNSIDKDGHTALHIASFNEYLDIVRVILSTNSFQLRSRDYWVRSVLHLITVGSDEIKKERNISFLTDVINGILKDPFIRSKILGSRLFATKMETIDVHIRLQQFISVSASIFNVLLMKMYGSPVKKCSMKVVEEDTLLEIVAFRNILMLTDEQVEVTIASRNTESKMEPEPSKITDTLSSGHSPDTNEDIISCLELVGRILRLYLQLFPSSFIMYIYEKHQENIPRIQKTIIVVDSVKARNVTIEKLQEIFFSLEFVKNEEKMLRVFERYLNCIVDHLIEQCNDNLSVAMHLEFTCDEVGTIDTNKKKKYVMNFPNDIENEIDEPIKSSNFSSPTLSGVVLGSNSNDEKVLYAFTTGHKIEDHHIIKGYNVVGSVWPSMLSVDTAINILFDSTLPEIDDFNTFKFVSDITVLQPEKYRPFYEKASYEEVSLICKYDEENNMPLLPDENDMLGIVHYRGKITKGTMNVIGYGHCSQWFSNSANKKGQLYERFYVAEPIIPENGSELGDSGAYCFKRSDDDCKNDRIHSFLVGKIDNFVQEQSELVLKCSYMILTPAHFALEQIKKITGNRTLRFVRYTGVNK